MGRGANNGPREKGIVASIRKFQSGQTQLPGGPTSARPGGQAGTMEKFIVSSRGLRQITKQGPPGGRGMGAGPTVDLCKRV